MKKSARCKVIRLEKLFRRALVRQRKKNRFSIITVLLMVGRVE